MDHLKHSPLVLFVALGIKGLALGFAPVDATICIALLGQQVFEKIQFLSKKDKETHEIIQQLSESVKDLERVQKDNQNSISTIRTSLNFKGGKL